MSSSMRTRGKQVLESARSQSGRQIIIGITCVVVMSVSLLSCITYISLMGDAFPDGLFRLVAYLGAIANFLLMIVLLAGKFNWFRSGSHHEWASWGVTFVEVAICTLNLMLAYQLDHGGVQKPLIYWLDIAPASPVFSMVGAILLITLSSDLKRQHAKMEMREDMEEAEQGLIVQQHEAQIGIQETYIDYVAEAMSKHLNSEKVAALIAEHAEQMVLKSLTAISGLSTASMMQIAPPPPPLRIVESKPPEEMVTLANTKEVETDGQIKAVQKEQKEGASQPKKAKGRGANTPLV